MITPFTDDNKIDYNGVKELLKWYERKGVDGIFAICQSSEIFFLSFEERLELIKFIMANKPEGMSIVASGHTSDDLEVQIKEAKAFIESFKNTNESGLSLEEKLIIIEEAAASAPSNDLK
jgi:4-hydroxy-tetrahydrodipicolinate synthase